MSVGIGAEEPRGGHLLSPTPTSCDSCPSSHSGSGPGLWSGHFSLDSLLKVSLSKSFPQCVTFRLDRCFLSMTELALSLLPQRSEGKYCQAVWSALLKMELCSEVPSVFLLPSDAPHPGAMHLKCPWVPYHIPMLGDHILCASFGLES